MSTPRRGFCPCGVDVFACRRTLLQNDGKPSIVALRTATLLAAPVCRVGFAREPSYARSKETDTNVEICSETSCGNNDGIRCDQFRQDRQRWLDSGNATVKECFVETRCRVWRVFRPAMAAAAGGTRPKAVGRYRGLPMYRQHSRHDNRWCGETCMFSKDDS